MKPERILVIDDEPTVTTLLGRYLKEEGFICQSASDAGEALGYFREGSFSAALVDIRMRGKDGIALLEEMKALDPDLATIMVTAVKDRESAVRAMKLGADDYIVKPFNLDEVLSSLQRALEKRRLTLENRAYHQELERLVAERTRDLERRNQELSALNTLGATLSRSLDLDEVLSLSLDQLLQIIPAETGGVYLWEGDELRLQAHQGTGLLPSNLDGSKGTAARVLHTQQPALRTDADEIGGESSRLPAAISEAWVPLRKGADPLGMLIVASSTHHLTEEDLRLLVMIGDQISVAADNARLYQETMAAQQRSNTILSEAFAGIMVVDANLHFREFNPAAETITGYQASEVVGHPLQKLFGPEMYGEGSPLHQAITSGKQVLPTETIIAGRRGRRDILLGVTPLAAEGSASTEYLLSFADVTQLKEVERLKSNLVANVSHELRSPLASIRAYTELLMEDLDEGDAEVRQRFLKVIDQETQHLADLITDLLNVARLESGGFEPHMLDVSLRDVAEQTLACLEAQAQQRGIQLVLEAPPDLPHLLADPEMMGILLKNLVSNSIKFSPHGGEVKVSLRADDGWQTLEVTDQGIGIGPEDLPHIFQKFYRAHGSIEAGFEGTGLGLTLVKEVVEVHGGSVEVQSELGKGTRFAIALPMTPCLLGPDDSGSQVAGA